MGRKMGQLKRYLGGDIEPEDGNVDDYFEARMYSIVGEPVLEKLEVLARIYLHEAEYTGEEVLIGQYLETYNVLTA
jgi:hypothetical protein